ncbi:hypothetical protein PilKf_00884 [Pillotina sp. SPG140]
MLLFFGCAAAATDSKTPMYPVTFITNGGSPVAPQNVTGGTAVAAPEITKSGAFFEGWYTKPDFTEEYKDEAVTGPLTLYAKWGGYKDPSAIWNYLIYAGKRTAYNPVPLTVELDLSARDTWMGLSKVVNLEGLFSVIDSVVGTYVDLDLFPCSGISVVELSSVTGKGKIVSLTLPETATSIDDRAFQNFSALRTVSGSEIRTIGESAFENCYVLAAVDFPEATTIGDLAFYYTALETVNFPNVTTIGESAFEYCAALETAIFPMVEETGYRAFYDCRALKTVDFSSAETISDNAFSGCIALETAIFLKAEKIGQEAFYDCRALKTANFPAATRIGDYAFEYCYALETVNIPGARTIGIEAFYDCRVLKTVDFSSAETISDYAFEACKALEEVDIQNAKTIGTNVFQNTGSTSLVIRLGAEVPTLTGTELFYSVNVEKTVTLQVPSAVLSSYNTDTEWIINVAGGNENIKLEFKGY